MVDTQRARIGRSSSRRLAALTIVAGCAAAVLQPAAASAAGGVQTWDELAAAFAAGGTVMLGADITRDNGDSLTVPVGQDHAVTLDLAGKTLRIREIIDQHAAIDVSTGAVFSIMDSLGGGTLDVIGGSGRPNGDIPTLGAGAGIGGSGGPPSQPNTGASAGSVTIDSGNVRAVGGVAVGADATSQALTAAAGIGGGGAVGPAAHAGDGGGVEVHGGRVYASSGNGIAGSNGQTIAGTGIGGGAAVDDGAVAGNGGSLVITGGVVSASSGYSLSDESLSVGLGVGGGAAGGRLSKGGAGGTVRLTGGQLIAEGYELDDDRVIGQGQNIGGGSAYGEGSTTGAGADVTISDDSTVRLTGGGLGAGPTHTGSGAAVIGPAGSFVNDGLLDVSNGSFGVASGQTAINRGRMYLAAKLRGSGTLENSGVITGSATASIAAAGGSVAGNGNGNGTTALRVTDRNVTLSLDDGAGSSTVRALHAYAPSIAASRQSLPKPTAPRGSVFTGWYDSARGGSRVSDSTDLRAKYGAGPTTHTLYARYARPTIVAHVTSSHPRTRYGWFRGPVTVSFTCNSNGVALGQRCPAPVTLRKQGARQSVTRSVRTRDGSTVSATASNINIDTSAPSAGVGGVTDDRGYLTAPRATCGARDRISGIVSCRLRTSRTKTSRGTVVTYTARAVDRAGNARTATERILVNRVVIAGVPVSDGAYTVHRGHTYDLFARTGGARPVYVDAAPFDRKPAGEDVPFRRAGRVGGDKRWTAEVLMEQRLRSHRYWNIGVWIGKRLYKITIRVVP